ncbi:conserved hypothetical protein [Ricinus communis]|uniref:Uncharacterized protein n=1 Tax=Ricinus communis TaxID=3988 RepID=B9SUG1_RICCO|nr:conserved hypothetical protein [Ricinus communis]
MVNPIGPFLIISWVAYRRLPYMRSDVSKEILGSNKRINKERTVTYPPIGHNMKDIRERFDEIAAQKGKKYHLTEAFEIIRCPELFSAPEEMHCLTALRELKISLRPELCERCNPPETGEDWSNIHFQEQCNNCCSVLLYHSFRFAY